MIRFTRGRPTAWASWLILGSVVCLTWIAPADGVSESASTPVTDPDSSPQDAPLSPEDAPSSPEGAPSSPENDQLSRENFGSSPEHSSSSPRWNSAALGDTVAAEFLGMVWPDSLSDGSLPPYQNGETLRLGTLWDRSDLIVEIVNLSSFIAGASDTLALDARGDGLYDTQIAIPDPNTGIGDGSKLITFVATTPSGVTTTQSNGEVCLTNRPPDLDESSLVPSRPTYQGGDFLRLDSKWTPAPGLEIADVRLDLSGLDSTRSDPFLEATLSEEDTTMTLWEVSFVIPNNSDGRIADGEPAPLVWIARDSGCGETRDTTNIELDHSMVTAPTLIAAEVLSPLDIDGDPRPLRRGDTFRLLTTWDRENLAVAGDFSELAPGELTRPTVIERSSTEYELVYTLPTDSLRVDGNDIRLTVTAQGPKGPAAVDRSVSVCLSHFTPIHIRTRLLSGDKTYTNGDSLFVSTTWITPSGLPLEMGVDLSFVSPATNSIDYKGTREASDSTVLRFGIPSLRENRGPDGDAIPVPIVAREVGGCATSTFNGLTFRLDTTPPKSIPVVDRIPEQVFTDSLTVTGTVGDDAARVVVQRDRTDRAAVIPDPQTGRWSARVSLIPNAINLVSARSEDEYANRSPLAPEQEVRQVQGSRIFFESPFPRGEIVSVQDPSGMQDLTLEIYDLEGAIVRRWTQDARSLEFNTIWDGLDEEGNRVRQGYFLVRGRWRDDSGKSRTLTEGLILAN